MPYKKKIVCLANSWKHPSGRCFAGKEIIGQGYGQWVRPVSERNTRELKDRECSLSNGQIPALLDVVEISFEKPVPEKHQKENHLHSKGTTWRLLGNCNWGQLEQAIDKPDGPLWHNGFSSSNGINDRVPENFTAQLQNSLYLIQPDNFSLMLRSEINNFGSPRPRIRAIFRYNNEPYNIAVTDPQLCQSTEGKELSLPNALICISLGEIFGGYAYKLAAGIITPD
jgi:hypothetical protein